MSASDESHGEILKSNLVGRDQVQVGMTVLSMSGDPIGHVKEVREGDFLVDRSRARDIYIPYRFVLGESAAGDRFRGTPDGTLAVVLALSKHDIDAQEWAHP